MKKQINWVGNIFMAIFKIFPIKNNRIYFMSRYGSHYGCNPKAFLEYLTKNHNEEFEFYYCLNKKDKSELPSGVKSARYFSLKDLYYLATSKYVFTNVRFSMLFSKRKKQIYIQTWHGSTIPYKKIEKDANVGKLNTWNSHIDSQQIDRVLVGSKSIIPIFEDSFYCKNKVAAIGTPRCDILINKNEKITNEIRKKLHLSEKEYVVLYAPTFRERLPLESLILNNKLIKETLEKTINKPVKILYRFHPHILTKNQKQMTFEDYVLNVTNYPDMQDLLLVSDLLITDFSSCMFEMMIAGKPCIIFAKDGKEYLKNERGTYISPEETPFPKTYSEEELRFALENLLKNENIYGKEVSEFLNKHGCVEDGHACERLYELMLKLKKEKDSTLKKK